MRRQGRKGRNTSQSDEYHIMFFRNIDSSVDLWHITGHVLIQTPLDGRDMGQIRRSIDIAAKTLDLGREGIIDQTDHAPIVVEVSFP